ncbi:hypothetical protein COO59_04440 [Mixta theicola]|uniref:Uncharacterized protein n=1 Tax=Mixta theicola TaxID=1458355 RepID=A0A2K1QDQ3_9GAMM|nr:hypothetical protein COO59_04440 [Mixta theicola]GLR09436.1 hypothetical protein GCM10007905_21560 [Mixta theicola]
MQAEVRLTGGTSLKKGQQRWFFVVAQRKAGILSSWRKENEIFTREYGKIYTAIFCVVKGGDG